MVPARSMIRTLRFGTAAAALPVAADVGKRFPDSDKAAVLFADALMNLQPWDY